MNVQFVYDARGNGGGQIVPTLTGDHQNRVTDYTALCVGNGQLNQMSMSQQANCLDTMHDQQAIVFENSNIKSAEGIMATEPKCIVAATQQGGAEIREDDKCPTITAAAGMSGNNQPYMVRKTKPPRKYIVRRLTPLECCRLQGFPDYWEEGVPGSDSARYKMWGNGMALPNMLHVMRGIKRLTEEERK